MSRIVHYHFRGSPSTSCGKALALLSKDDLTTPLLSRVTCRACKEMTDDG